MSEPTPEPRIIPFGDHLDMIGQRNRLMERAARAEAQAETLREALRELVDSRDALEGETVSFELRTATVDRYEAAIVTARAALGRSTR